MSTPGTPTWLRTHNDRSAFRLFLDQGPLTRKRLGELSGLSKPTAGQMIARLERLGLIEPVGEASGARGPSAVSYGARTDSMTGVAVSVLADAIEAVVVDPTDGEHPVVSLPTADREERSAALDVCAAVEAACAAARVRVSSVSVITVGVQAAVDTAADSLSFSDTLPGWPREGSRAQIEAATGCTVIIDNDVNLAAVAERASGAVDDLRTFIVIWLGDGLGAGIDVDGEIQRGFFGAAGEIGYLEVPRSAASIDPAARDFTDLLGKPALVRLAGLPAGSELADALALITADPARLDDLASRIALLIAPVLAVLDPSAIVLGGPTGRICGPELADRVRAHVAAAATVGAQATSVTTADRVQVRASASGVQPVLRGARGLLVADLRERLLHSITLDSGES